MIPLSIKTIQSALRIPETGVYDEFTEAAVRNFQMRNSLMPTGVVDRDTADMLGLEEGKEPEMSEILSDAAQFSTDLSETAVQHRVNIKKLPKRIGTLDNYMSPSPKEYLFLHHTAGWENPYKVVDAWAADTRGPIATQYLIGGINCQTLEDKYDGEIVQCMDYSNYGWHLGIGNTPMHRNSVGIELCNFGYAVRSPKSDFTNYVGKRMAKTEIVDLGTSWRGHRYFHRYTDKQIDALRWLILKIGDDTGIDITQGLKVRIKKLGKLKAFDYDPEIVTGNQKGMFVHANVSGPNRFGGYDKWDLFPQDELVDMINGL